jgi:beta-aspartyl-peptidase (threonine type)
MNWTICGTRNTHEFMQVGVDILEKGGAAVDAVEQVIKLVELNKKDWSVGYNGFPNLLGQTELDASIMIGSTKKAGSVAGIKKYINAISIARQVMEQSPHVLLVGEGAELFAKTIGFEEVDSLTDDSMKEYYENVISGNDLFDGMPVPQEITDLAWRYDQYIKDQLERFDYRGWYTKLSHQYHGTVNVIAMDKSGEICSGVSTSGLSLKFPGRAGDSPIIGAGNYCDLKIGAATCVGTGEHAIRLCLARQTVNYIDMLGSVELSVKKGIQDLFDLDENGRIQILAMDKEGNVSACTNGELHYIFANHKNPVPNKINTISLENT